MTFTWTADGQLSGFSIAGGATVAFQYDAFGRLARRDVNGSARSYFLWDGSNLLAELDGTGAGKVAEYNYYGTGAPHAIIRGGFAHHAHLDALGNVVALTNLNRQATRTNQYDEWGHLVAATDTALGDSARARWKGALWMGPELELYYMRNRWYEPQTGRFLSEDPMGLEGGINAYAFGGEDPIGGSDPSGLDYLCQGVIKKGTIYATCVHIDDGSAFGPGLEYEPNVISGGPGRPGPARRQDPGSRPAQYTPVGRCQLGPNWQELRTAFYAAASEGLENGGYITGAGRVVTTGADRRFNSVFISVSPNADSYWHIHVSLVGGSGPSYADSSLTANVLRKPFSTVSLDSVFVLSPQPGGKVAITGCGL